MTIDLLMICDACGKPIGGEQRGCLWVDRAAADRTEEELAAWRKQHAQPDSDGFRTMMSSAALRSRPTLVPWQAHHGACDPDPDAFAYDIGSDALRTYGQLLERTAHLMGKPWLQFTDWPEVLRGVHGGGRRLVRQPGASSTTPPSHPCTACSRCSACACSWNHGSSGLCRDCDYDTNAREEAQADIARWKAQLDAGSTYAITKYGNKLHRWDCPLMMQPERVLLDRPGELLHRRPLPQLRTAAQLRAESKRWHRCRTCNPDPL